MYIIILFTLLSCFRIYFYLFTNDIFIIFFTLPSSVYVAFRLQRESRSDWFRTHVSRCQKQFTVRLPRLLIKDNEFIFVNNLILRAQTCWRKKMAGWPKYTTITNDSCFLVFRLVTFHVCFCEYGLLLPCSICGDKLQIWRTKHHTTYFCYGRLPRVFLWLRNRVIFSHLPVYKL